MEQNTERMCAVCGASLPPEAQFCPKCGSAVSDIPTTVTPRPRSRRWIIGVTAAIAVLVAIIWAIVGSKPQGEIRRTAGPAIDTIGEGTSGAATASIGDTTGMQSEREPVQPPMTSNAPPPPTPSPAAATGEIPETQARAILARYLDARDPYHTPANCLDIRGSGYSNRGFAFDVVDTCQSRSLGSWRVDSLTRELFERKPDGRYLRP